MKEIEVYHAHIYFNEASLQSARELYEKANILKNVKLGRFNEREVGPHTMWSFMILFNKSELSSVIPWLTVNKTDHSILIHPETGNDLLDHTEYAMWLGKSIDLDTSKF